MLLFKTRSISNKIINGVKCKLWDKQKEIDTLLKNIMSILRTI